MSVFGHKLCDALAKNDPIIFTQQFDPYTCEPQAAFCTASGDYGPSILAFMGYTSHLYGVELLRDRAIFSTNGDCGGCEYTQVEGEHEYTVKNDGKRAAIFIDGREMTAVECGVRIVTDLCGNVLSSYPTK